MDFRQLETFVTVIKLKSFSKAAQKLFLTQPTVTSHIQNLENELGTLLINRSGKTISPTQAGEILYKHSLNIINMRDMAQFDLGVYKGKIEGHLEISSSSIPRQYVLPNIIKKFILKYPNITFSLQDNDSKNVVENILSGDRDFGIIGAKYNNSNLSYLDLIEDNLVVVTPNTKEFQGENGEFLEIDTLLDNKIILREKGSGTRLLFERALKGKDLNIGNLNVISYIRDTETIKKFIKLGLGISVISKRAIEDDALRGELKYYNINGLSLSRKFYFAYHNNRQLSPLGQTFRDFMIDYISKK